MRLLKWTLPVLLATTAQAQPAAPRTVTLAEAIALASRADPNVIQARGAVRNTGSAVRSARGQFLPNLSTNVSGGSSFSEGPDRFDPITNQLISGDTKSQSLSVGATSDITLFDGFGRNSQLREARRREDAAGASLEEALSRSALETANEFYSALSSRELVQARQRSVERAERQLAIAVARLQTRAATVADSLRAVVQLGEARLQLASELATLARFEANLARRLGMPGRVQAVTDPSLAVPGAAVDTSAVLAEALSRAPAVRRAESTVRAAEASVAVAKATWFPTLSLSGRYNYSGNDAANYRLYNSRSLTLGISWPIFNRFQRNQAIDDRQVTLETEQARLADARRQVSADLTAQFAALDAAGQRIDLTRLSVEAAQADVTVALERYRLGSISITDLNAAESGLIRAEEQAISARYEYLRAKAQIEAILGRKL